MKILNAVIIILGFLLLIARSMAGYSNNEVLIYDYQFSFVEIFLLNWTLLIFFLTATIFLDVNIIARIIKKGEDLDNKAYIQSMLGYLMIPIVLSIFTYSENVNSVLNQGWTGIFHFPFFWSSFFLLNFWLWMPRLEEIVKNNVKNIENPDPPKSIITLDIFPK